MNHQRMPRMNGMGCGCSTCGDARHRPANMSRDDRRPAMPQMPPPVRRNQNSGCGCGCHSGEGDTNCQKLLEQIRAVDFALYEVILYLDVYPNSCEALDTYHKLCARQKALHQQYETTCGPITAAGNVSQNSWDWISKPFPWENDAN